MACSDCSTNCSGGCSSVCSSSCSTTCSTGCSATCESNCSTSCSTDCSNGCSSICSSNCSTICSTGCTDGCSSACSNSCSTTCSSGCSATCESNCSTTCSLDCSLTCSGTNESGLMSEELDEDRVFTGSGMSSSTTSDAYYTGDEGVAWVRDLDTSPLTFTEIISGVYTLEVDYLTITEAAELLACSSNEKSFNEIVELLATGAASTALTAKIVAILGVTSTAAINVTSVSVGAIVSYGWNKLQEFDRDDMLYCFEEEMKRESDNEFMKIKFTTVNNTVTKSYSSYESSGKILENPYPQLYGNWHFGDYGYLYSLPV